MSPWTGTCGGHSSIHIINSWFHERHIQLWPGPMATSTSRLTMGITGGRINVVLIRADSCKDASRDVSGAGASDARFASRFGPPEIRIPANQTTKRPLDQPEHTAALGHPDRRFGHPWNDSITLSTLSHNQGSPRPAPGMLE